MFHRTKQRCFKFFAAALAFVFFCTNIGFAYSPQTNIWAERGAASQAPKPAFDSPLPPQKPLPHNEPFLPFGPHFSKLLESLKHSHGKTRGVHIPKNWNKKVVVHIQDIHQNAEAQTNIGKSLEKIFDVPQVGLLALEGEFETINLSRFRNFSDQKTLKDVADYFLRKGEMAGSIHAALFDGKIPALAGVDDLTHYNANVEAYRSSSKLIEETKSKLSNDQKTLQDQKAKTFSKELSAFDQRVEAYRANQISLADYLGLLTSGQDILPLQLELFKETLKMEAKLDFKKVERERTILIATLAEKLSSDQTEALTRVSQNFHDGKMTAADFYLYLQNLCNDAQLPLAHYPAFDSFVRYTLMADNIDMDAVMSQLDTVEADRYAEIQTTAEEKDLLAQSKYLHLAEKLIDYSLSSKEWMEYKSLKPSSPNASVGDPLKLKNGSPTKTFGDDDLTPFEKFYEEAEARDEAMAANLLSQMGQANTDVAILVSGGFHSEGISKRLSDAGVATIIFVPTLTKVENTSGAATLSVFNQEKGLLDQLFEGTKLFLTARPTGVLKGLTAATSAASAEGQSLLTNTEVRQQITQADETVLAGNNVFARVQVTRGQNGVVAGVTAQKTRSGRATASNLLERVFSFFERVDSAIEGFFSGVLGISYMVSPNGSNGRIGLRDIDKATRLSVLSQLFLHTDGIGFIAPAWKLHTSGILELFADTDSHNPLPIERIVEHARKTRGHANEGFLETALWALASQGWIVRKERDDKKFNYFVTEKGKDGFANIHVYKPIFDYLPDIIRMNQILFTYPSSTPGTPTPRDDPDEKTRLKKLILLSKRGWDLPETRNAELREQMRKQMDGLLIGPIMIELRDKLAALRDEEEFEELTTESDINILSARAISQSMGRDRKITETEVTGKTELLEMVFDLLAHQGWVNPRENYNFNFTAAGLEEMRLAWSYGVPVSYAPLYNRWETLLFGQNPEKVFEDDEDGNERHVNRLMNAKASGYTHRKSYMEHSALKQKLKAIFDQPLENQPKFVADMGCGDGALLRLIFDYIKKNTLRGQHLDTHPLLIIGADYNHYSQAITKFNLDRAGVPNNDVIFGNINDPDRYAKDLKKKFGLRMQDGLHVRSMLDHNRPFIEPDMAAAAKRTGRSKGVFTRPNGSIIPNNVLEQNLYEHYKKWAKHIGSHGLLTIELQTLPPEVAAENIGKIMTTSYGMSHFPSCQYTIEATIDIDIAREAGFEVNDPILIPKDLPMVTIKHLTVAPQPSTWGISGKNIFNTAATMLLMCLVFVLTVEWTVDYSAFSLTNWVLFSGLIAFPFFFQSLLIVIAVTEADFGASEKAIFRFRYNLVYNSIRFFAQTLGKLPGNYGKYYRARYTNDWLPKINQWNVRQGLILPFENALNLDRQLPPNPSRWIRIKYFFRQYQIVGIQYGDIAINRKAMALLPHVVQYWFLRYARNLLWYKLAVRKQKKAPAAPTFWDYFKETLGNMVEGVVVNLADIIPFARASNVPFVATKHMRELTIPRFVKESSLLPIPEIADVFDIKVWTKMESEHESTAFKYRIIGQILNWFGQMTAYERTKFDKILVASTGNQALAIAMAVQVLRRTYPNELAHLKAVAYVAGTINPEKLRKLTDLDVELVHKGRFINAETKTYFVEERKLEDYGNANEAAEYAYLHNPRSLFIRHGSVNVMQAYSTVGPEFDSQLKKAGSDELPTAVLVPLGAGGLYGAIKYVLINLQKNFRGLGAWISGTLQYRRYRTFPVITTDIITGLLSQGLLRAVRDFYLAVKAKADGIAVPYLDSTALEALTKNDEVYAINPDRLHFARMLLINLLGRFDIEHTSSLPLAILMQYGGRLKELGFKQTVLIISGGNAAEPDPKDPTKIMRDPEILRQYWLDALIDYAQSDKMSNREGHPDRKMALAALKKQFKRIDLNDDTRGRLNAAIEKLSPTPPTPAALEIDPETAGPASVFLLWKLAFTKNLSSNQLAKIKQQAKVWILVEVIAMSVSAYVADSMIMLIFSSVMLLYHLVLIVAIAGRQNVEISAFRSLTAYVLIFGLYAAVPLIGFPWAGFVVGGAHIVYDMWRLEKLIMDNGQINSSGELPKAESLGVKTAGPILRTVELSQSKNIDRILLPVLADLARFPNLKVAFNVAPIGDDSVNTIAAAVATTLAGKNAPRDRMTFNLDGELSLEAVLAEAHSGQPQQFANGLWKTPFAKQSARIELIKTTDRWTPLSGTLKVGDWMTVTVDQVLQVLFRMDDESVDLGTMIQGALAAMKAA